MEKKGKTAVSLALNAAVVVLVSVGVAIAAGTLGWGIVEYYTVDSNLFLLAAAAVSAAAAAVSLAGGRPIPAWVVKLKYYAVCTVSLTFLVVITVLGPLLGGWKSLVWMLFQESGLFLHLLAPVTVALSFWLADAPAPRDRLAPVKAMAFTGLYAAALILLNFLRVVEGPYPFLKVYEQPWWMSGIWFVVILGMAAALAWVVWRIKRGWRTGP